MTGVDLSDLPESLHCGRADVPMDYSKPMSRHNMITLGLAMYRPKNPKGVLFVYVEPMAPSILCSCHSFWLIAILEEPIQEWFLPGKPL